VNPFVKCWDLTSKGNIALNHCYVRVSYKAGTCGNPNQVATSTRGRPRAMEVSNQFFGDTTFIEA
jgi:hypothetical protein